MLCCGATTYMHGGNGGSGSLPTCTDACNNYAAALGDTAGVALRLSHAPALETYGHAAPPDPSPPARCPTAAASPPNPTPPSSPHPPPPTPATPAKNIVLAGVRAVTFHDKKAVSLPDLSAQFYLTEADVGKNRAEASKDKLQELNTAVAVTASTADLTDEFVAKHQVRGPGGGERGECCPAEWVG